MQNAAMLELDWEECALTECPNPQLERMVRRRQGFLPPGSRYLFHRPWIVEALGYLNFHRGLLVHTDFECHELLWLVVSRESSCRYCYAAHRAILSFAGMSEGRIQELERDHFAGELDPKTQAALQFGYRVAHSNPPPTEADFKALKEVGYEQAAIVELAASAALIAGINRVATLPALPPVAMESLPSRWYLRLARPLLGRALRGRFQRGELLPVDRDQYGAGLDREVGRRQWTGELLVPREARQDPRGRKGARVVGSTTQRPRP